MKSQPVFAAEWLHHHGRSVYLHTYGQPMPGFENFSGCFDRELPDRLVRFINQSDIVPRLPGTGYRHCGLPKHIVRSGQLEGSKAHKGVLGLVEQDLKPLTEEEARKALDELERFKPGTSEEEAMRRLPGLARFTDHLIDNYIKMLAEIRDTARRPAVSE